METNRRNPDTTGAAIGIDLGTTYCCLAIFRNNRQQTVDIIPNTESGRNKTPSYIAFPNPDAEDDDEDSESDETNEPYFGETAKDLAHENLKFTIYDVKRMYCRQLSDPRLQRDMKYWPFDIAAENETDFIKVKTGPASAHTPVEITALLIKYLHQQAENFLSAPVTGAVVCVPARFNAQQRQSTLDACALANLNVIQLVNEPTAAAVAYRINENVKANMKSRSTNSEQTCLIVDLGGGTFDLAVLTVNHFDNKIHIKAIGGDSHLGGEDIDNNMVEYCVQEFQKEHGFSLTEGITSTDPKEALKYSNRLRRLKLQCEMKKKYLTQTMRQDIQLDAIHGSIPLNVMITRDCFNTMNMEIFERCIEAIKEVLVDAKVDKADIDEVILVGGSCRIPRLQELVSQFFGGKKLLQSIDADEAVATGAAMLAFNAENVEITNILIQEDEIEQPVQEDVVEKIESSSVLNEDDPQPEIQKASEEEESNENGQPDAAAAANAGTEENNSSLTRQSNSQIQSGSEKFDIGIYISAECFKIGHYGHCFTELLEIAPYIRLSRGTILVGQEAKASRSSDENVFLDIYELLTSTKVEPLYTVQTDGSPGVLCIHQILALFVQKTLSLASVASGGNLVVTIPFEQTSIVGERIKKSAKLAGFADVTILTTLIAATIGTVKRSRLYGNDLKLKFPPKYVFVLDVGMEIFSIGLVLLRPAGILRVSVWRSENIEECQAKEFKQSHATLYTGHNIVQQLHDQYRLVFEKAIDRVLTDLQKNGLDSMIVSESTATLILQIVENILKKKFGNLNSIVPVLSNPLLGAALFASSKSDAIPDILPSNISLSDSESSTLVLTTNFKGAESKLDYGIFSKSQYFSIPYETIDKGPGVFLVHLHQKIGRRRVIFECCRYQLTLTLDHDRVKETESEDFEVKIIYEIDEDGMYTLHADIEEVSGVSWRMERLDKLSCNLHCDSIDSLNFKILFSMC